MVNLPAIAGVFMWSRMAIHSFTPPTALFSSGFIQPTSIVGDIKGNLTFPDKIGQSVQANRIGPSYARVKANFTDYSHAGAVAKSSDVVAFNWALIDSTEDSTTGTTTSIFIPKDEYEHRVEDIANYQSGGAESSMHKMDAMMHGLVSSVQRRTQQYMIEGIMSAGTILVGGAWVALTWEHDATGADITKDKKYLDFIQTVDLTDPTITDAQKGSLLSLDVGDAIAPMAVAATSMNFFVLLPSTVFRHYSTVFASAYGAFETTPAMTAQKYVLPGSERTSIHLEYITYSGVTYVSLPDEYFKLITPDLVEMYQCLVLTPESVDFYQRHHPLTSALKVSGYTDTANANVYAHWINMIDGMLSSEEPLSAPNRSLATQMQINASIRASDDALVSALKLAGGAPAPSDAVNWYKNSVETTVHLLPRDVTDQSLGYHAFSMAHISVVRRNPYQIREFLVPTDFVHGK